MTPSGAVSPLWTYRFAEDLPYAPSLPVSHGSLNCARQRLELPPGTFTRLPVAKTAVAASKSGWATRQTLPVVALEQGLVEHDPAPATGGAGFRVGLDQAFGNPLAGHFDQSELGDVEYL